MGTLKIVDRNGIAVVTFARPPVNVMDSESLEELTSTFERLAGDAAVKAAVLTGEGNAFSAGLDLKTVPNLNLAGQHRLIAALNDSFGTLYAWPKPLVAAVNGHAMAGGLVAALCADWRVAADVPLKASLAEVRVGVKLPVAAMQVAIGALSPPAARRMVLLARLLTLRARYRSACSTRACLPPRSCRKPSIALAVSRHCRRKPSPPPNTSYARSRWPGSPAREQGSIRGTRIG